jgi:hypothetical protein
MKSFFVLVFCGTVFSALSQDIYKYAVYFKSKGRNNPFSINQPEKFLSARSLERKHKMKIPITKEDLPINPFYISEIQSKIPESKIVNKSRWFNYIVLETKDSTSISKLNRSKFIKKIIPIYSGKTPKSTQLREYSPSKTGGDLAKINVESLKYSKNEFQNNSLKINELHKLGHLGNGVHVAVFDGGFSNVDKIEAFHHLRKDKRILGVWDFVANEEEVYGDGDHGTMVLACMAGYVENEFIGTAPLASYWLLKTEDGATETLVEEYNWISAAEFSDSAGVDIINSSLGYTSFDKGKGSHSYADMDGKTTVISKGANKAVEKGMIVVNSAGNSGNDTWRYIGAPADAEKVFSIGATTQDNSKAKFSSFGPTSNGKIKPNVCALGYNATVIGSSGKITSSSGTSFSSPIMCGAIASLIGQYRFLKPELIMRTIESTAHNFNSPNYAIGYGIPDFWQAHLILSKKK